MEDDGFTLVKGKKAGKFSSQKFKKTQNGTHIRVDGTEKDVENAMTAAKLAIQKSGLAKWAVQKLKILAGNRKIQKIYLVGNGHFDSFGKPGAHQLAFFLDISKNFDNSELIFQEPICSKAEISWLKTEKNVKIREEIDTKIDIPEDSTMMILGIIHGEHEIFNTFLAENEAFSENSRKIDNLIVIGNNYGSVDWALSKLSEENPKINKFFENCCVTVLPEVYEPHSSAFSSTVIMSPILKD